MSLENLQIKKLDLDKADNSVSSAMAEFDRVQKDVKEQGIKVVEKLAFYSAGIISLTVTYLGYLLNQESFNLGLKYFHIPLYVYLYTSWILFGLAILLGTTLRKWDSFYTYFSATSHMFKERADRESKLIELVKSGYPMIYRDGEDGDLLIQRSEENQKNADETSKWQKMKEEFYWKVKIACQWSVLVMFSIAIMLVLFFAIISSYSLIS